jgi:hypothetical protein
MLSLCRSFRGGAVRLQFDEKPTPIIVLGSAIIAAAGLFVIWRERQLALPRQGPVETTSLQTP